MQGQTVSIFLYLYSFVESSPIRDLDRCNANTSARIPEFEECMLAYIPACPKVQRRRLDGFQAFSIKELQLDQPGM